MGFDKINDSGYRQRKRGKKREVDMREVVNAIFYILRAGCSWRMMPHDLPACLRVYSYFRRWERKGVWHKIHTVLRCLRRSLSAAVPLRGSKLREASRREVRATSTQLRQMEGRDIEPSAGIIDSQTVKTTEKGGVKGYDAGKKINGRKRHILVDTMGLILMIDARNVYRVVTRKIRDFSEEQLQNITAITWLYRGQQERYLGLVGEYLNKTHQEAGTIEGALTELESPLVKLTQMLQTFSDSLGASLPLLKDLPEVEGLVAEDIANQNIETFRATLSELEVGIQEFTAARVGLIGELQVHLAWFAEKNLTPLPPFPTREGGKDNYSPPLQGEGLGERFFSANEAQKECAARFVQFIPQLKTLQKHINDASLTKS